MRPWLASILVLQLAARVAVADDVETAAQVHLDRGIAAFGAADYATARAEFQSANELVPYKANPYRWLALTEVAQGDCAHARLDVDSFVSRVTADDPRVPELVRARDSCRSLAVDRVVAPPRLATAPQAPTTSSRSLVTRWWFWAAVGGLAVTATGLALLATHGDAGPARLPAITCTPTACTPEAP